MLTGWWDVSMYKIYVSTRRKDYVMLMNFVVGNEFNSMLPYPSPPNNETCHNRGVESSFKERFLEKSQWIWALRPLQTPHSMRFVTPGKAIRILGSLKGTAS